jgi:hypothetical protein
MRLQATEEGLASLKNWVKSALDRVIQVYMGEPGLQAGSQLDAFDTVPKGWTVDRMRSCQVSTRGTRSSSCRAISSWSSIASRH